jgi:hypothetical protein
MAGQLTEPVGRDLDRWKYLAAFDNFVTLYHYASAVMTTRTRLDKGLPVVDASVYAPTRQEGSRIEAGDRKGNHAD